MRPISLRRSAFAPPRVAASTASAGDMRISAYLIIKGLVFVGLMVWIANIISSLITARISTAKALTPSVQTLISQSVRLLLLFGAIMIALSAIGINLTALTDGARVAAPTTVFPAGVTMAQALKTTIRAGLQGLVWAAGLPRRREAPSTRSSCSRVAACKYSKMVEKVLS